ncbi:MAG: hypothetical protein WBW32_10785 [Luteibacter sp.]
MSTPLSIVPTWRTCLAVVLAIVVLIAVGFGLGYVHATVNAQDRITKAATAQGTAEGNARAASASLEELRRRLAVQDTDLKAARQVADAALHERDELLAEKQKRAQQDEFNLRKKAHEAPDCAALARLPVCPVVADGLWGSTEDHSETGGNH